MSQLAKNILKITQLDARAFEEQLKKLVDTTQVFYFLTEILSSQVSHPQKQLAASGINYLVMSKLAPDHKNWREVWHEYSREVLMHRDIQIARWRHLRVLIKGLSELMYDMEDRLPFVFNDVFLHLSFKARVLLYEAFLQTDTTRPTQAVILRETIEEYLLQNLKFVCWLHEQSRPQPDYLLLELALANILDRLMLSLSKLYKQPVLNEVATHLTLNHELFQLVVEWLLFDFGKSRHVTVMKQEFRKDRIDEVILYSRSGSEVERSHSNQVKAKVLSLFATIVNQFDKKSQMERFDTSKNLSLMEIILPYAVQELIRLVRENSRQVSQNAERVMVSLLQLIKVGCNFNFMLQFLYKEHKKLIFDVVYPLLTPNEDQEDDYRESPREFIRITEEMTEDLPDQASSPRNKACQLLEAIVDAKLCLHFVVSTNLDIIQSLLTGNRTQAVNDLRRNFDCKVSVEASLTMLTVLSSYYEQRKDILEDIKRGLLDLPEARELRGMSQAKLLIFLSYNYKDIYMNRQEEAVEYLKLAADLLPQQNSIGQSALLFFCNCIQLGFGRQIWTMLMEQVSLGEVSTSLSALRRVASEKGGSLPLPFLQEMVGRVLDRLILEYKKCQDLAGDNHQVVGGQSLIECLNILEQVSDYPVLLQENEGSLIELIWPVFDLFEYTDKIEFEDNILRIFNNIARASKQFKDKHYAFVDRFPLIVQKNVFNFDTLETYTLLLKKGRDLFLSQGGTRLLANTLESLKMCYSISKRQKNLRHICIFFQYAYFSYGQVLRLDEGFMDKLLEIYQDTRRDLSEETLAAIINLFLTAEFAFGRKYPAIIEENSITIFKDYQAQVAALNFSQMILSHPHGQYVIDYLRYSIRLLHFLKSIKTAEQVQSSNYYSPLFPTITEADPFQVVSDILDVLKRVLQVREYDGLMEDLRSEIRLGDVRDLLTRRQVGPHLRTVVRVKNSRD